MLPNFLLYEKNGKKTRKNQAATFISYVLQGGSDKSGILIWFF
jgi:hypothetical protein